MMGFSAGVMLAGVLFPPRQRQQSHGKIDDLRVSGSQYGSMVPQVYGMGRVSGNLVWVQKDSSGNHLVESSRPIRASKGGSRTVGRKYSYTVTMAWVICRGPIQSVRRIWANDKLIYDATAADPDGKYAISLHLGTEAQTVDPVIEAAEGVDNWTAYRGLAYVVMDDFPLDDFGNAIPNISVEVAGIGAAAGDDGLLAWYRFEDDPGLLQDSGPNNYDLTETIAGATQVTGPTGYGEGLRFNDSGNHLGNATGDVAAFQGALETVMCWFKYLGSGSQTMVLWYRNTASTQYPIALSIATPFGGVISVSVEVAAGSTSLLLEYEDAAVLDGAWHHVAVTYNGSGDAKLYFDFTLVDSIAAPYATLALTGGGDRLEIDSGSFDIDEPKWYSRELSPGEIAGFSGVTVADILEDQFAQVGLTPAEWDTSDAEAKEVPGFVVASRVDVRQANRELLMVTDLDLAEIDGQIVAIARGGASVVTIPVEDLGAYVAEGVPDTDDPPDRVSIRRLPVSELPYRLDLEYLSQANNYQQGQATAVRFARVAETQEQLTVSTPIVFAEDTARRVAETLLYRQWWERVQAMVSVGPRYLYLAPGDVVTLPAASGTFRGRIEQMDVDPLGVIQLTCVQDAAEILTQYVSGAVIEEPFVGLPEAVTTFLIAWAGNALIDAHAVAGDIGIYVAAGGPFNEDWPGAALFWSRDGGTTYTELASLSDPATLGNADTALAAPPGGAYDLWDDTNTVDVEITSGDAPETSSDSAVLNGANAAILGDEVIQFVTVTSLGGNVYRLGRLLRGRRGTESFGGAHAIGDRFVSLEDARIQRVPVDFSLVGKDVLLKAVTIGTTVAAASPVTVTVSGAELLPYAPTSVAGTRNGSNDLTVTWIRRTRAGGAWADLVDVDQPESTLIYEVEILDAPGGNVLRTITGLTVETASYLASEQVTDGLTPGDPVDLVVYQLGQIGRGYPSAATV